MVAVGVALLVTTGTSMMNALESDANQEQLQFCMDETDHRLGTVAATGRDQPMDIDDSTCRSQLTDSGSITATWFDGSDPTWSDDDRTISEKFGTLEFELDDRTIAHQGGGVWETSDDGATIEKAPNIGFGANGTLQLNVMEIDSETTSDGTPIATYDATESLEAGDEFDTFTKNPKGDHFALRIESEYAEGWERHFEREKADATGWNVEIDGSEPDAVVLIVRDMGDVPETSHVLIEDNHGLAAASGSPVEGNLLEQGQQFHINATLRNDGDAKSRAIAELSIWEGSTQVASRTIESKPPKDELAEGETIATVDQNHWEWSGPGNHKFDPDSIGLTPGTAYEYDIETEPGGDSLEERETFYYLADGAHYTVVNTSTDESGSDINVSAEIRNLGTESGDAENVTLEIQPAGGGESVNTTATIELNETEGGTVSWSIDDSAWPKGTYEYTVETPNDSADGAFTVTDGGAFVIDEDLGVPEDARVDGTDGQIITDDTPVTIAANITNTYAAERTQTVTLDVLDDSGTTVETVETVETTVAIDGGETARVELTGDTLEAGELYEYNVSTEDDELDRRGSFLVVEEPSEFAIEGIDPLDEPITPNDSLAVDVTVENQDTEDDTQYVWLEGFGGTIVAVEELDLAGGETRTVTLEWGSVDVPDAGEDATITAGTDAHSDAAPVDLEPLLEVRDVEVQRDPVPATESATVTAELDAVGGATDQRVDLERVADGTTLDSRWVSVSETGTETVELEYDDVGWVTDRVRVRTDDDDAEDVVVVERDGPVCHLVEEPERDDDGYLLIENIDQLQCIDSGEPNDEHGDGWWSDARDDSLSDDYRLANDIDAHGTEYWNDGHGFDPIGDQERGGLEFSGDFDGDGHAIRGLHIDRPNEDFVGLFAVNSYFDNVDPGVGEGSTIRNLRLENVSVHGQQVTGGLIGAAGGVIENVRVSGTVEAEYQEVGGIAGVSHNADLDNRLVSEATVRGGIPAAATDEVEHPWGANNMGIGGIVGSTGWYTEVSTAYSLADVEGPFGVGGIVGWTSDYASANEQMYWAEGDITITADRYEYDPDTYLERMGRESHGENTGGAIFGRGDDDGDEFADSVYYNGDHHDHPFGEHVIGWRIDVNERTTDEMQGLDVTDWGNLSHLDYEDEGGPWVALPDDYPRFAWELAAEGQFDVEIDAVENVTAGEAATIDATVTSRYENREETNVTQTVSLTDPDGQTVDTTSVTLPSTLGVDESEQISLVWQTDAGDNGTSTITVRSADMKDTAPISVESAAHGPGESNGPGLGPAPGDGYIGDTDEFALEPGASDGSSDGAPEIDPDIDVNIDVIEID